MVDEPRRVAAARRVDHHLVVHREQHRVRRVLVLGGVAPVGFAVRDALADVLHDARALGDVGEGEYAPAMNLRAAHDIATPVYCSGRHEFLWLKAEMPMVDS
jgi:hypothetical protein